MASPVRAAHQLHATRSHLFLEVEVDGVVGLGEASPQPVALNGDAGIDDVVAELEIFVLPQLLEMIRRESSSPNWARVSHLAGSRRSSAPASALLEMALIDLELRSRGAEVKELWPPRFDTPTQLTVSLLDEQQWTTAGAANQVRAKVSASPVSDAQWCRLAELGLPVLLDFNCSAENVDSVCEVVQRAGNYVEVVAAEQPFAPGNVVDHARLAGVLAVAVSLDEGVRNRRDLDQISRYGAARMICVKPSRVGGFAQAKTMIERAEKLGLGVYLGGFFESPLGRRANRSLAHHLVSLPSDLLEVNFDYVDVLRVDPWGWGYLAGDVLEATEPLVTCRG